MGACHFRNAEHRGRLGAMLLIIGILAADRAVKLLAAACMAPGESRPIVGELLQFTFSKNTGAAFGLGAAHTWLVILFNGILMAGVFYFLFFRCRSLWMMLSLAAVFGGGLGNLIDRICLGYVMDMFDLRGFAIFNVADIFVCSGCVLFCLSFAFSEKNHV
jgi:signal peptidase II